jgi:hypothetical protein
LRNPALTVDRIGRIGLPALPDRRSPRVGTGAHTRWHGDRRVTEAADLALSMTLRLSATQLTGRNEAGQLVTWAADHLDTARLGADLFTKASPDLDDNWTGHRLHTVEIAAQNLVFRGVVTAMDLCASAVFRLAEGTPPPDREFDMGQWLHPHKNQQPPWGTTPDPLKRWVESFDGDSDWELAVKLRDAFTHRTTRRHVTVTVGSRSGPVQALVDVDGTLHASTGTMRRIVNFGLARFRKLADAMDQAV